MYKHAGENFEAFSRRKENPSERNRLYQVAKKKNLDNNWTLPDYTHLETKQVSYALLGFCCDIGIKRNQGVIGAKEGPKYFRKAFYSLPLHNPEIIIYDCGDVHCSPEGDLESAQRELGKYVEKIARKEGDVFPLLIGGGHEMTWGGLQGYYSRSKYPSIINFDAHFDLRQPINQKGNSGTSFYQAWEHLKEKNQRLNYFCAGIQPFSNTQDLFRFAQRESINYCLAEDIRKGKGDEFIEKAIQDSSEIYVTICLDAFQSSVAPGVSSPQPMGIDPGYVLDNLRKIKSSGKCVCLEIAELNPKKDINMKTAELAALIVADFCHT